MPSSRALDNMVDYVTVFRLAGSVLGALGGVLLFFEFFQEPSYVTYDAEFNDYSIDISPREVREHTWLGRVGAFLVAVAFAFQFLATYLG